MQDPRDPRDPASFNEDGAQRTQADLGPRREPVDQIGLPKRIPKRRSLTLPQPISSRLERIWRQQRPRGAAGRDRLAQVISLSSMLLLVVWILFGGRLGLGFTHHLVVSGLLAVATGAGFFVPMLLSRRAYDRQLDLFMWQSFDEDGRLTYCIGCGYDMHGCARPRTHCPECGKATWRMRRVARCPGCGADSAKLHGLIAYCNCGDRLVRFPHEAMPDSTAGAAASTDIARATHGADASREST